MIAKERALFGVVRAGLIGAARLLGGGELNSDGSVLSSVSLRDVSGGGVMLRLGCGSNNEVVLTIVLPTVGCS